VKIIKSRITGEKILGLLRSLEDSKITGVKWEGRYSRSRNTYWLRKVKVELESGKHKHVLECYPSVSGFFCSWFADGEEIGVLEIDEDEYLGRKILDVLSFAVRLEDVDLYEQEIKLRPKPILVPQPVL